MYEVFEHTADLGLRIHAATLADLCADAARGLGAVITGDLAQIRPLAEERFDIAGTDPVWLLYDLLSEVHAAFELRRMLFCDFQVSHDATGLQVVGRGEPYDSAVHTLAHEVKAITQHELDVRHDAAGWQATVIVDI
jgi:SHS2 domain-containing protein